MSIWNIYECVVTGSEDTGYEVEGLTPLGEFDDNGKNDIISHLYANDYINTMDNFRVEEYAEWRIDIYDSDGIPRFSLELKI